MRCIHGWAWRGDIELAAVILALNEYLRPVPGPITSAMDEDTEMYLMLLLSDGNLPTGSFVASSGLEAYIKHGFFGIPPSNSSPGTSSLTSSPSPPSLTRSTINFVRDSLETYAHSSLPFISAVHDVCLSVKDGSASVSTDDALKSLRALDDLYESMTLNHVARRASKAQGVALLTLLSRGMTRPSWLGDPPGGDPNRSVLLEKLADALKIDIRKDEVYGHLPICWGVLTATLGLSCGASFPRLRTGGYITNSLSQCHA